MSRITRTFLAVAATLLAFGLSAAAANATSPDPYNTTSGTGTLLTNTILGPSSCDLSNINASLSGGTGSVSSAMIGNCRGLLTGILRILRFDISVDLTTNPPSVTAHVEVLIRNALGGECLYAGLLTGSGTSGTGNATVDGSVDLVSAGGTFLCNDPADVEITVSFPGLSF